MEMCRVCLSTEKDMHPLDETFISHYNILTNLNITLFDGMPQFSCKTCLDTVKYFIEFREKSIASESTLRDIIINTNVKSEIKNNYDESELSFTYDENDTSDIKQEIKLESDDNRDNDLNNFDVALKLEELDEDFKSIVKKQLKDVKPKRKKHVKKTPISKSMGSVLDDGKWFCGICPKSFENENDIQLHLDIHKDDRKCLICGEKANSLSQLLAHRLKHVPANQLRCHICRKRYRSCMYLEHHYRTVHIDGDGPKLQCSQCYASFSKPKRLSTHMLDMHSNTHVVCDICSKTFPNKTNLKSHIKKHFDVRAYSCNLCGYTSKYSSGITEHKIRRHSEKKVYCKRCSRPFIDQQAYEKHKCIDKIKVCSICGIQICGSSKFSRHMRSHSNVCRYECTRCPAKYKTKAALIAHTNRHDGNRTVQCEYCPAKFYTTTVLIKHRRIHTGEKPYVCQVCNKGFTGGNNLKVHMKVHGQYLIVKKNSEPDLNNLNNVTK